MTEIKIKTEVHRLTSPYTATGSAPDSQGMEIVDRLIATKSINAKEVEVLKGVIKSYKPIAWKTAINKGQRGTEMSISLTFGTSDDCKGFKDEVTEKVPHLKVL